MKKIVDIYYVIKVYDPKYRNWFTEPEKYDELNHAKSVARTVYGHSKPVIARIIEEKMEVFV